MFGNTDYRVLRVLPDKKNPNNFIARETDVQGKIHFFHRKYKNKLNHLKQGDLIFIDLKKPKSVIEKERFAIINDFQPIKEEKLIIEVDEKNMMGSAAYY